MATTNNIVVVSDTHCGCQFALCPPNIKLDGGGTYQLSPLQVHLWGWWQLFWPWAEEVTRGEPYDVVVNGDIIDYQHHGSTTQVSQNPADQKRIALEVFRPIVDKCNRFFVVRGTEAHSGKSSHEEETIARELGAEVDEIGNYSRDVLDIRCGSALCNFMHTIGTTGSSQAETGAIMKELTESWVEAARWRDEPYDFIIRSHRHRHAGIWVPTAKTYAWSFTTPAWQGKTPFASRIVGARQQRPQFGGCLIRQGKEDFYVRQRIWHFPRTQTVE